MENRVKKHFEDEAIEYDETIIKLIPYYKEMVHAIVSTIPFENNETIDIIDLGCGTGSISQALRQVYPIAKFTLVDIAENMLKIAQKRLGTNNIYINTDFNNLVFSKKYDIIVSSLALHHLETDLEKQIFYEKIYGALKDGGIFINGDVVKAQTEKLQEVFIQKWIEYMNRSIDKEEIENRWMPNYYAEDRPIPLTNHLDMLYKAGFQNIDIIWKYYGFCVYKGDK